MSRKRLITALTVGYIAVLTTLSLVQFSAPTPDLQIIGFDKVVHFGFYFGLNTLLVSTIIARCDHAKAIHITATTIASIAYGVAIEFIQQQVGRDFDIYDIVANSLGAIIAAIIIGLPQINRRVTKYLCE